MWKKLLKGIFWSILRVIMDEADIKERGLAKKKKKNQEPQDVMTIKETGRVIPRSSK